MPLYDRTGMCRWFVLPQRVHQVAHGDGDVGVQEQRGEQTVALGGAERQITGFGGYGHRTEQAELH